MKLRTTPASLEKGGINLLTLTILLAIALIFMGEDGGGCSVNNNNQKNTASYEQHRP